jgi:carboxypeptidase family protein
MNRLSFKFCLLFLASITLLTLPILAQTGAITGSVVDAQGNVIVGAAVKAVDQQKGAVMRETVSGGDGIFTLQPLQPGTYTIRVSAKGMKDLARPDINLDQYQVLGLGQLMMNVGAATETVTVEATTPLVETATADHSAVIDSRQVSEISMNGRDFQSLVRTLPGVVSNDTSDFRLAFNNTDSFHVDGQRGSSNNVYLDGAINTDVGANDGQYTQLSMDAVGEFKLQTSNFSAEYGRNPGVRLAIDTKSGTQQFHGTVYEFHRENGFDANQFFNKVQPNGTQFATPQENGKLRFNQYGANIGGPIPLWKYSPRHAPKMFFFFNYEGTKAGRPNGGTTYNMPNPAWLGMAPDGSSLSTGANFSSALTGTNIPTVTVGTCPAYPSLDTGTVFIPGTIQRDASQNIICGTPYPGNIVPAAQFSSQLTAWQTYLKQFYKAGAFQDTTPGNLGQYIIPFQDNYQFNKHQEVVRYDWNINAKTNFFFRWVDDSQREAEQFQLFAWGTFPGVPEYRKKPGASWSWNLINAISPTTTNEFIFSYNHLTQVVDQTNAGGTITDKTKLGFSFGDIYPNANLENVVPGIDAGPLISHMFMPRWTSEARQFTWTDNVTKIHGAHTLKFGVFFDYNQAGQQPAVLESPQFNFNPSGDTSYVKDTNNGVANLVLGNYYNVQQANGIFFGAFRFHQFEMYGADSWKVNRKLTLDYGLRWAYIGPTYTVKPYLQYYFDPTKYDPAQSVTIDTRSTDIPNNIFNGSICTITSGCPGVTNFGNPYNGMVQENSGIPPGYVDHKYRNFEPRLGFAYDPSGNGKMAIRGGVGIFHERIRQNVNSFDGLGNPPLVSQPTFYNGAIDQLSSSVVAGGALQPSTTRTMAKNGDIPTLYAWSLGVQRELPWQMALDATYVGNLGRHEQFMVDLNQFPVGFTTSMTAPPNGTWLAVAPYKGYTQVNYTDYGANSKYNALQLRLLRRFSKSLTLSVDYTYSKNIDLSDTDDTFASVRDRFHPKQQYGPTGWDRPHVFNLNYVYDFPEFKNKGTFMRLVVGGWESSGVVRAWSGTPFSMSCGGNSGATGGNVGSTEIPLCDRISGVPVYLHPSNSIQWINPLAFAQPMPGTIGDTTRNEFRGPGYQNWNLSLFKNFNFREHMRLQLRLETFNTWNHVEFGGGSVGSVSSTSGGVNNTITTAGPGLPTNGTLVGNSGKINSARDPRQIQLGAKFYF